MNPGLSSHHSKANRTKIVTTHKNISFTQRPAGKEDETGATILEKRNQNKPRATMQNVDATQDSKENKWRYNLRLVQETML